MKPHVKEYLDGSDWEIKDFRKKVSEGGTLRSICIKHLKVLHVKNPEETLDDWLKGDDNG